VFTLTLPPQPPQRSGPKTPATRPPSDWELMRRHLRGEDVKQTTPPPAPRQPDLTEALLKLLADNGQHFGQLGAKETLTIAVTFRSGGGTGVAFTGGSGAPGSSAPLILTDGSPSIATFDPKKTDSKAGNTARDLELLADLQLKQNKVNEAVLLYHKAVDLNPGKQQLGGLYSKLARAYLTLEEQTKDAKHRDEVVQKAMAFLKKMQDYHAAEETKTTAAPKAVPLPSRLIVSAPKESLHAYAAGAITFEQFRQAATVEWLHFPAEDGKTAPKAGK
jgi:hypothetical protein